MRYTWGIAVRCGEMAKDRAPIARELPATAGRLPSLAALPAPSAVTVATTEVLEITVAATPSAMPPSMRKRGKKAVHVVWYQTRTKVRMTAICIPTRRTWWKAAEKPAEDSWVVLGAARVRVIGLRNRPTTTKTGRPRR